MNIKLLTVLILLLCSLPKAALADDEKHKGVDLSNSSIKCETECHTPENVKIAQENKVTVDICKDCHVGPDDDYKYEEDEIEEENEKAALNTKKHYKDMILIPAGEFKMGTDTRWDDEGPSYTAYLPDYFIDTYEVSNADYKKFVDAAKFHEPNHWNSENILKEKGDHPVVYVNWNDAKAYCKWAEKRLPTQEEWEKAGRGTDGRNYPYGNDFDPKKSNNPLKKTTGTEPVNSYENGKSPYGLFNMSGNVWEWTDSWYKPYPGNSRHKDTYGEKLKVLKGGSWYNCGSYDCGISAYLFNRAPFAKDVKSSSFGFRCAK